MAELTRQELLTLREIHLTGQASSKDVLRRLVDAEAVVDTEVCGLLLTGRGRELLVRGSPSLWDVAA
jgi:hypothetical protein